jgi:hypothetical protein
MSTNCGQTNTPTTDDTPLPCDEFKSTRCSVHEEAISYLGLGEDTPLDVVLDTYLTSLIDARNRVTILEAKPSLLIKVDTTVAYTLVAADAQNRVSLDNAASIAVTVPDDATLNYNIGTEVTLLNLGAGTVTIGGAGITFIQNVGLTITSGGARTLIKVAADTWVIKY